MKINGSQILVEVLVEQGVDTVFGYPGGAILNIYDALYLNSDRIHHILTAHEQGASHAADGYARATGKTGVCLATSGPGATNLVTGIATAYMDSIPMVAITANVGTSLIGKDSFQEVYIAGITMPITKHNFVVRHVEELADTLRDAFRIAQTGRPGPVLVDIPKDVTANECEFENKPLVDTSTHYDLTETELRRVAKAINTAKRPVIYFGGGVAISGAGEQLAALMRKADIPASGTMMAIGSLSTENPLYLGMVGMHGKVSQGLRLTGRIWCLPLAHGSLTGLPLTLIPLPHRQRSSILILTPQKSIKIWQLMIQLFQTRKRFWKQSCHMSKNTNTRNGVLKLPTGKPAWITVPKITTVFCCPIRLWALLLNLQAMTH